MSRRDETKDINLAKAALAKYLFDVRNSAKAIRRVFFRRLLVQIVTDTCSLQLSRETVQCISTPTPHPLQILLHVPFAVPDMQLDPEKTPKTSIITYYYYETVSGRTLHKQCECCGKERVNIGYLPGNERADELAKQGALT